MADDKRPVAAVNRRCMRRFRGVVFARSGGRYRLRGRIGFLPPVWTLAILLIGFDALAG